MSTLGPAGPTPSTTAACTRLLSNGSHGYRLRNDEHPQDGLDEELEPHVLAAFEQDGRGHHHRYRERQALGVPGG
jgi:hypothetical protein